MWRLLFLAALAFNIVLLYTLASQWSARSCRATAARDDKAAAKPYKYKNTAPLPPHRDTLELYPSHELSPELLSHGDCGAEVRGSLAEYLCRVESSVSFYSASHPPTVIAKDISFSRYFARRDLLGWSLAFKNISFDVVEVAHRAVSNTEFSVFLCLGITRQEKHCMKPSSYHLLHQGQKVNQIHGIRDSLWRKDGMCLTLREALADYSGPRNFTFPCWVLPSDREDLIKRMRDVPGPYIVKPNDRGEGYGIFVVNTIEELDAHFVDDCMAQPLLTNPYLIQGKKFDLRTYVLVTSMSPLRAYFYHEGLVRFASSKYNHSEARRGNETQVLTNTSVGKKYARLSNLTWTFHNLRHYLTTQGVDAGRVFSSVQEAIIRTLLSAEYRLLRNFRVSLGGYDCRHCFQLLGVDVILDSHLNPYVIEVNGLPSMQLTHELGASPDPSNAYTATKFGLLHDILQILFNTSQSVYHQLTQELTGIRIGIKPGPLCDPLFHVFCVDYKDLQKLLESKREYLHRGNFIRIYPTPDGSKYSKLIHHLHNFVRKHFRTSPPRTLWQTHHLYTALEKLYSAMPRL
jgi:hypothetical protein